jgi:hypothetical protein
MLLDGATFGFSVSDVSSGLSIWEVGAEKGGGRWLQRRRRCRGPEEDALEHQETALFLEARANL